MIHLISYRRIRRATLVPFLLIELLVPLTGQLSRPGRPYPLTYPGSPALQLIELPVSESLKAEAMKMQENSLLKSAKSGLLIDVDTHPGNAGVWDTLSDGMRIWRTAFHAAEATRMNLLLAPYNLEKGVRIFIYSSDQQYILGAFSDLNNKETNILPTAGVPGDLLIIEMQVPHYVTSFGSLTIDGVGCDFHPAGRTGKLKDGWYGASAACNIDVRCTGDTLVQEVKRSVVRIVYDGIERCTGTLLNNTQEDGVNYVLTAEHCISTEALANTAVFYFDYESPWCEGPDGNDHKSVAGATLRATGNTLDFTLLELLEPVPFTYKPYFAGWDVSGYPPAEGFTVHHPLGDVKKLSREDHALSVTSFGHGYADNTHWLVRHWESGTTEIGSSGAPFFDNRGRIVGTLSGGMANCDIPINDYFQMLSHSWDDFAEPQRQLAYWLDPSGKGAGYLDGFDPYQAFWSTGDTLSNIDADEQVTTESGTLSWGSYSGHNSDYFSGFAESFSTPSGKKMIGLFLWVADNAIANPSASIIVKVWQGGEVPGPVRYAQTVLLTDLAKGSMNFIEFDSVISISPAFFAGFEVQYHPQQDTFSVFMAENRTVEQLNTAWIHNGYHWQTLTEVTGGEIYSSLAIMPVVYDALPDPIDVPDFQEEVIAYPSPAHNFLTVEFQAFTPSPVELTLISSQGQVVLQREYGPFQRIILLDDLSLASGIYVLRIRMENQMYNLKISIMQ